MWFSFILTCSIKTTLHDIFCLSSNVKSEEFLTMLVRNDTSIFKKAAENFKLEMYEYLILHSEFNIVKQLKWIVCQTHFSFNHFEFHSRHESYNECHRDIIDWRDQMTIINNKLIDELKLDTTKSECVVTEPYEMS